MIVFKGECIRASCGNKEYVGRVVEKTDTEIKLYPSYVITDGYLDEETPSGTVLISEIDSVEKDKVRRPDCLHRP